MKAANTRRRSDVSRETRIVFYTQVTEKNVSFARQKIKDAGFKKSMGDVENPAGDSNHDGEDNNMCVTRNLMAVFGCLAVVILVIMIIGIFKGEEHM
tara:strand:+ start:1322 stop:1612 length:291 start_codon:yes stop_codon:yes gene_type:complete